MAIQTQSASHTDWFCRAQWGLFFHYLAAPPSTSGGSEVTADDWNHRINAFDVERLADLAASIGAGYVGFTIGQNSGHYCSPNSAYDRIVGITPSKCSRRDLIADLAAALKKRKLGFIAYLPTGAPEFDPVAREKLHWRPFGGRMAEFQILWNQIIREWSLRWGDLVDGWWMDGAYEAELMYRQPESPNGDDFAAALRASNPRRIIAWNPGVKIPILVNDPHEDYTAGETNQPQLIDCPGRWLDGKQFHVLSFLGKFWGAGIPRFSDQDAIDYTLSITHYGGVMTWDVPINLDSSIPEPFIRQLAVLGKAMDEERHQRGDSLDLPPAPRHPQIKVKIAKPMVLSGPDLHPAEILVECRNPWPDSITGKLTCRLEPEASGKLYSDDSSLLRIPAGGCVAQKFIVVPTENILAEPVSFCYQRDNDSRTYKIPVPIRRLMKISGLPANIALADVESLLADKSVYDAETENIDLAAIRFGLTKDHFLAVYAEVVDRRMLQTPQMWDGSCIEIFGSPVIDPKVHQLFISPATQQGPAHAGKIDCQSGRNEVVPAPEIAVISSLMDSGYRISALIPLSLLGATPHLDFLLEFSVTGATAGDQFQRATVFGSGNAAGEVHSYAVVRL